MIIKSWKQAACAIQGKDHKNNAIPCQDKVQYVTKNGVKVIALADGAGSRKHSETGAQIVANAACEYIANMFPEIYMLCEETGKNEQKIADDLLLAKTNILSAICDAIVTNIENDANIDEYASTLLFFAFNRYKYVCGHIGDGVIGTMSQKELPLSVLSQPENGGAPNITYFTTDNTASKHLRLYIGDMQDINGIILMSDGPEEVLYDCQNGFTLNVNKILNNYKGIEQSKYEAVIMKLLTDNIAKYSFDDLSINLLYLETIDTTACSMEYAERRFDVIKDKNQIVSLSHNSVMLDDLTKIKQFDFCNAKEAYEFAKGIVND